MRQRRLGEWRLLHLVEVFRDAEGGVAEAAVLGHAFTDVSDHSSAAVAQRDVAPHAAFERDLLAAFEFEIGGHALVVDALFLGGGGARGGRTALALRVA